jgi:hypothetical protein
LVFLPNGPDIVELYINTSKWWAPCQLCSLSMRFVSEWWSNGGDLNLYEMISWNFVCSAGSLWKFSSSIDLRRERERERACTRGVGSCFIDWFECDMIYDTKIKNFLMRLIALVNPSNHALMKILVLTFSLKF